MQKSIHRRDFVKNSAAALALGLLPGSSWSHLLRPPAKRVALIGTGWYGKSDLFRLMQVAPVDVVAICDVDKHQLDAAAEAILRRNPGGKSPRLYGDYRQLLNESKADIVLIGTPDHWHALQTIDALKAGAHVYVQKPISTDVLEGEAMLAAARKYNRVVQVGMQRRSTPHLIEAKKNIIEAGLLGKIAHAEVFCYYHMRSHESAPEQAVPDYFNYDMWTGPAPLRPFDGIHHRSWRAFMEYGNGIMGDMCVHMLDTVRWMLGLGWPNKISSTGGIFMPNPGKSNISDTQTAVFEFDGLNCVWQHRTWGTSADPDYPWGFKIYGEKGTLCGDPYKYDYLPNASTARVHKNYLDERDQYPADITEPDIEIHAAPATRRHMLNFLDCIDKGGRPVSDIEQGHISTASCIIANLSMQLGRPLHYDPDKKEFTGDAEASRLLRRRYRSPWQHPWQPGA